MGAKQLREKVLGKSKTFIDTHIKIQGSMWDKKRKLDDKAIKKIRKMRDKGITLHTIAEKLNVSVFIVHYHTSAKCREKHLKSRNGIHYGNTVNYTIANRIDRKKGLIEMGKVDNQLKEILC